MGAQLFRKISLARLSSPEQLDQLMQVTSLRGWIALLATGLLILSAIIWSIFGDIDQKAQGTGILLKSSGVSDILSPSSGTVKDVYFEQGETIEKGQVVARIYQPELLAQIREAKIKLQNIEEKHAQVLQFDAREEGLKGSTSAHMRAEYIRTVAIQESRIAWLKEKIQKEEQLFKDGLITKQQLMATNDQLSQAQQAIAEAKTQSKQLDVDQFRMTKEQNRNLMSIEQEMHEMERTIALYMEELDEKSKVISGNAGRILEIGIDIGSVVQPGTPVMKIEITGKEVKSLEAVMYFPATEGKKIHQGMKAQISPSTVKQEEYGFLLGLITRVSEYPASQQVMMKTLHNEALVAQLSLGGPPLEVHADLIPDPTLPSKYKWSSGRGPQVELQTGTICNTSVAISAQRPIDLVIPALKKKILGVGTTRADLVKKAQKGSI